MKKMLTLLMTGFAVISQVEAASPRPQPRARDDMSRAERLMPDGTMLLGLDDHLPKNYNVYYRNTQGMNVVGVAPLPVLQAELDRLDLGYRAIEFMPGTGLGAVNIVALNHTFVRGCTCPADFKEFYIGVLVAPVEDGSNIGFNVVRLFEGSNHSHRIAVMAKKFDSYTQLAQVNFDGATGHAAMGVWGDNYKPFIDLKVNSQLTAGDTAFQVVFRTPGKMINRDNAFYYFAGGGSSRVANWVAADSMTIDPQGPTQIGTFLRTVGYTPVQAEIYDSINIDQTQKNALKFTP